MLAIEILKYRVYKNLDIELNTTRIINSFPLMKHNLDKPIYIKQVTDESVQTFVKLSYHINP
jgi:hypothetical protein